MTQRKRLRLLFIGGLIVWVILGFDRSSSVAQEKAILTRGQFHYQRYCEVCHGPGGKGNGPLKEYLTIVPADLTRLSRNSGGEFPFWEVYRTIDGRKEIPAHGARSMPIWGHEIQVDAFTAPTRVQEDLVAGRIWQIILYLQSFQQ